MKYESGFIAITSAIIISVLLLAITASIIFSGYFARFNVLDSESKERSLALAEACVDMAVIDLSQTVPIELPVGSDKCWIKEISESGSSATVKTQGMVNKAYSNIIAVINTDDFTIVSWEEVPNF